MSKKVWILWRQHSDRSNAPELLRAYLHEDASRAEDDFALVKDGTLQEYHLTPVPIYPFLLDETEKF